MQFLEAYVMVLFLGVWIYPTDSKVDKCFFCYWDCGNPEVPEIEVTCEAGINNYACETYMYNGKLGYKGCSSYPHEKWCWEGVESSGKKFQSCACRCETNLCNAGNIDCHFQRRLTVSGQKFMEGGGDRRDSGNRSSEDSDGDNNSVANVCLVSNWLEFSALLILVGTALT